MAVSLASEGPSHRTYFQGWITDLSRSGLRMRIALISHTENSAILSAQPLVRINFFVPHWQRDAKLYGDIVSLRPDVEAVPPESDLGVKFVALAAAELGGLEMALDYLAKRN